MNLFGMVGAAASAGSLSAGAAERAGKLDAASHSLGTSQQDLSPHPLDRDPSASPDRDADGWTGGSTAGQSHRPAPAPGEQAPPSAARPRLPDDPCGGQLDVTA